MRNYNNWAILNEVVDKRKKDKYTDTQKKRMEKIQKASQKVGMKAGAAVGALKGVFGSRGKTPFRRGLHAAGITALGTTIGYLGGKYGGKMIGKEVEKNNKKMK